MRNLLFAILAILIFPLGAASAQIEIDVVETPSDVALQVIDQYSDAVNLIEYLFDNAQEESCVHEPLIDITRDSFAALCVFEHPFEGGYILVAMIAEYLYDNVIVIVRDGEYHASVIGRESFDDTVMILPTLPTGEYEVIFSAGGHDASVSMWFFVAEEEE